MISLEELQESCILETACGGYMFADDTGYFSVGEVRGESMNILFVYRKFVFLPSYLDRLSVLCGRMGVLFPG